ncbi:translin [Parasteatoda tepidariorum]|uniref:translin n=1 Tax=Parasteatoda tepidariorum TaxID=114398 RepID=UPI00077FE488|nr:translin [Parasteatoda tepidariorum]
MSEDYTEVFSVYQKHMEEEENLRETIRTQVKEMEQLSREIITLLQGVHKPKGLSQLSELCDKARRLFDTVRSQYVGLQKLIPVDEFYRYHEHWRYVTQRLIFSAAFIVFLESGKLLTREVAAEYLGISCNPADGFHIELDDFLLGLLLLAEELSRLSLNCATHGDYKKPVQIAEFVSEMNVGFRLLNLKNDLLRRKFDGLKYCLKKVEEVVYDLSIRGLKSTQESDSKTA